MAIKFPLKMSDETLVRTIEELREHFDLAAVLEHYSSGRLGEWLSDRYYDEEAEKVKSLDPSSDDFKKNLCDILGVAYPEDRADKLDLNDIARRNERRERLKKYTADDRILASVDNVAFTQEELDDLLEKADQSEEDEDENTVIYLCGEHFTIPAGMGGIIYKGVNRPKVEFNEEYVEEGIDLQDLEFDTDSYITASADYDDDNPDAYYDVFNDLFVWNPLLGVKLLHMAAEKGSVPAQYSLGVCYSDGEGVEKDYEEAAKWYRKAAEQNHLGAQSWLENYHSVKRLQEAAEQGDAEAQCQLGRCYHDGEGVAQDYEEAVKWFQEAAEQGHAEAQYNLSVCYMCGRGVEENFEEGIKWFEEAVRQGYEWESNTGIERGIFNIVTP